MNGRTKTRSTISKRKNFSIRKQIWKQASGICSVLFNIGNKNRIPFLLRWPNTTPAPAARNVGPEANKRQPWPRKHFLITSISLELGNTSIRSSLVTNFIKNAGGYNRGKV